MIGTVVKGQLITNVTTTTSWTLCTGMEVTIPEDGFYDVGYENDAGTTPGGQHIQCIRKNPAAEDLFILESYTRITSSTSALTQHVNKCVRNMLLKKGDVLKTYALSGGTSYVYTTPTGATGISVMFARRVQ